MNTRRQFQTCLLVVSILLTSLPVTGVAARPAPAAAPVHALPQTTEAFKFGKVDLELLEEVELLDKRFEKEGLVYHELELEAYLDRIGQPWSSTRNSKRRLEVSRAQRSVAERGPWLRC